MSQFALNAAGAVAGGLVQASTFPKIAERILRHRKGVAAFNCADAIRDGMASFGNAVWTGVGIASGLASMAAVCALNATLLGWLVALNLGGRRGPPAATS